MCVFREKRNSATHVYLQWQDTLRSSFKLTIELFAWLTFQLRRDIFVFSDRQFKNLYLSLLQLVSHA